MAGQSLFRGHVLRRSKDLPRGCLRRPATFHQLRQSEIDHARGILLAAKRAGSRRRLLFLRVILGGLKDDIVRFQIAVQHPAVVRVLNGFGNDRHQTCRLPQWNRERLFVEPLAECLAGAERRCNEAHRADFPRLVDGDEIGVIELRRGQGFANETLSGVWAQKHLRSRNLQRDLALQLRVVCQEYDPAPALPELPAQLEPTDPVRPVGRHRSHRRGARDRKRKIAARVG